ncbi:glycoside hydrolase family 32 protein [Rhodococcus sp. D2-41]|uniref:glycosyl hydrolase family 32 n=1 Tax=Speluncibacter jeojiensis TaxID=2710754 RepID=UPI00240F6BDF|nr:glycosyl hydrolase family 32 [Rhodococcus sp. D2-41]MDG3010239.1 glycoside hydrolase family 32 protein [Rhodococcus sp. D2-41]
MRRAESVPLAGPFTRIYDPGEGLPDAWYINDHSLIRDYSGSWHLFGITHREPAAPEDERVFAHATAPELHGPWTRRPPCLTADPDYGETHLWAPHVIAHEGVYLMVYAGGGYEPDSAAINLAYSTDLVEWTRRGDGPLFRDGYEARDPMLLWVDDRWVLYYCATEDPAGGHHVVAYRTSVDLEHWSGRRIAFRSSRAGTVGGDTESPFVVRHGRHFYLFVGPCGAYADAEDGYTCTAVYRSDSAYRFTPADIVSRVPAHAAEVVHAEGKSWITHAGWAQGGVHLARLNWSAGLSV